MKERKLGFFCDFDGTISENDMIAQIMLHFIPDRAKPIILRISSGVQSIQDGVEQMFGFLRSDEFPEIERFALETLQIRSGFAEFVQLCENRQWPLFVVSGGFDFFVRPALAEFLQPEHIYCNQIDTGGEFLRVRWAVTCDEECAGGCGMCKPTVMRQIGQTLDERIVIGDGATDWRAAQMADFVFARDSLLLRCGQQGIAHAPFDSFYDIISVLAHAKEM